MSGDIATTLSHIELTLLSFHKDVDVLKDRKRDLGAKSPRDLPKLSHVDDEVTTELSWAERMELEPGKAGDCIHPVKVRESTEAILQEAFTPLKNADRLTLRRQFLSF